MGVNVKDPTLYRVLAFLLAPARAGAQGYDQGAARARAALEHFARRAKLPPPDVPSGGPRGLAWRRVTLWQTPWVARPDGFNLHAFAQTRHSDGVLLLAVERDGDADADAWLADARSRWAESYGAPAEWQEFFAPTDAEATGKRLRLTGEAWLYATEWEQPPADGWAAFAGERYEGGAYYPFGWGVLGYRRGDDPDAPPLFELHAAALSAADRNAFLYEKLPLLLIDFVKVSQFIWQRHQKHTYPSLGELEARLESCVRESGRQPLTPTLRATEDAVRRLSDLLHDYSGRIAELAEDAHTVSTDCEAVKEMTAAGAAGAAAESFMLAEMRRVGGQLKSDLEYFSITERRAERTLQALQILVDIARARGENRLILIGLILATLIGFGQLLPDDYPGLLPDPYGRLVRPAASLLMCVLVVGVYLLWQRWRGRGAGGAGDKKS